MSLSFVLSQLPLERPNAKRMEMFDCIIVSFRFTPELFLFAWIRRIVRVCLSNKKRVRQAPCTNLGASGEDVNLLRGRCVLDCAVIEKDGEMIKATSW